MNIPRSLLILLFMLALNACALDIQEDSPTVKTAKACQRAKESNPGVLEGFKINACTNNGVWMVDQFDEAGNVYKQFDFVNAEYAGPESMGLFVPAAQIGPEAPMRLQTIRQALNAKLLEPKS